MSQEENYLSLYVSGRELPVSLFLRKRITMYLSLYVSGRELPVSPET
jgi:hypothetical protein